MVVVVGWFGCVSLLNGSVTKHALGVVEVDQEKFGIVLHASATADVAVQSIPLALPVFLQLPVISLWNQFLAASLYVEGEQVAPTN
jgi:hypothetical protein